MTAQSRGARRVTRRILTAFLAAVPLLLGLMLLGSPPMAGATATTITNLGTLGGTYSGALAVNNNGQVVGQASTPTGEEHAFSWSASGGMVDLGTLGGPSATANAVNSEGEVVGSSQTASGQTDPFVWTSSGGMVALGTLGGTYATARAINDKGQVVGSAYLPDGDLRAVTWQTSQPPSVGPIALPTAPSAVNSTVTASAPYTDTGNVTTLTATWSWGDGPPAPAPSQGPPSRGRLQAATPTPPRVSTR